MVKSKEDFDPRYIPAEIRREVRQACGFGCVICRCPLYEYDHIEEYSVVGEHTAKNLALLCPTCHLKKGRKQITKEYIRERKNEAKDKLLKSDQLQKVPYTIDLGSNLIQSFSGGLIFYCAHFGYLEMHFTDSLSLSGKFFDAEGATALEIDDNELKISNHIWDIEYTGSTIIFRYALRNIFLSIDINSEKKLIVIRGKYFINEIPIIISENGICIDGTPIADKNIVTNSDAGLVVTGGELTDESGQILHGMVSGHVSGSIFKGRAPIHIKNPKQASANIITSCHVAIYITHDFLIELNRNLKK